MRVSVISTVLNEEGTVSKLLDSILSQSRLPDEIIIVDGGSTDSTLQIINNYCERTRIITCLQKQGNISAGRNEAIKNATSDVIAQIDGGCIAHKEWLARIVAPFEDENVGLVAGFYVMTGDDPIQKAVGPFHGVTPQRFDPRNFLPSGRSMAFRKSTWEKVGGYSETLQWAGEDTLFNYKVVKLGIPIVRVPEAYVYWEVPSSLSQTFKKFYRYAIGDAQSGIWWHPGKNLSTHNIKIMSIFARYIIALFLLLFSTFSTFFMYLFIIYAVIYAFWSIWKHVEEVEDTQARLLIPIIQIGSDIAIMTGFSLAMLRPQKQLPVVKV